ncbi:unnamed protein product [Urochloa humidicola]
MIPFDAPPGVDPDAEFRLCVQMSRFTAMLDDGSTVDVPRKYDEWVVDSRCYTLGDLEKDIGSRVKWGSRQQIVMYEYEVGSGGERKLVDDKALSFAFSNHQIDKRMFVFVEVEEKHAELISKSGVTEMADNGNFSAAAVSSNEPAIGSNEPADGHVIDWDSIVIDPIPDDQIGSIYSVMDEDAMLEFLGLKADDERDDDRTEATRLAAEEENEIDMDLEGAELPVDDYIPGEQTVIYDREDPPMEVGTIYASMNEFRAAVRQHAIKEQFELGTQKSCKDLFRGYCKADSCKWSIVARLMSDKKQVRVTLNRGEHFCASTGRVRTKMASFHWVAEKAITFLKKDPRMRIVDLQKALEDKYQVSIGYSTVWLGAQKALEHIFGTWEESFAYLYNFQAEVKEKMPGSVVEIDVTEEEDGTYFSKFFCCLKPSIDGFLNGCRPYLSIDATALNGRWNGHLASATALDGHNWMFPVAFGFFDAENNENWLWFMQQLQKAIGNPPYLAISSDASKAIKHAVDAVYPWAEHRECFLHLMKNFCKRFQGPAYGRMWPAARTFQPNYHKYLMDKIYAESNEVEPFLKLHHSSKWMRSQFLEEIKCDHITNNVAEVWNKWVKDLKDLPIADLADSIRAKFMELYAKRRKIGEKLEGHVMLPIVVRQLNALSRQLGHLNIREGGKDEAEVTEVTPNHKVIRHVVNLKNHVCTCREWQVSGKPCPHALALITTSRNPRMEDFLHPYYSVYHFRLAYAGVIKPLPDKSQWPHVDPGFKVLPPLKTRSVGRQRKNRIPGCLEYKGDKGNKSRSKGAWKVQCRNCLGYGHRTTSPKCHLNGTKKRKSRAKKGPVGRPPGAKKGAPSTPKRQKVDGQQTSINTSPRPFTRSQLSLAASNSASTSQMQVTATASPSTRKMQVAVSASPSTSKMQVAVSASPSTPPRKKKMAVRKKYTPRKANK